MKCFFTLVFNVYKAKSRKQFKMYSVKQMYSSPKGNAGVCETICRVNSLEEAKEFLKIYCKNNSTQEFFDETGYNSFYIEDEDGMVEEAHDTGFFEEAKKEEKPAKVWLMTPDNKNIQSVPYDFNIKKYFPNGLECRQYCINNIMDYYVVFFDANDGGKYNASAKWIAPHCQVASTGNFIIMRKKWFDEEEKTVEMEITPKEFRAKYLK